MKALIADDDTDFVDLMSYVLGREGYTVLAAVNGHQAIERWQAERPDIVLLDGNMPGVDGFEVCRRIRSDSETPVIMLTGRDEEEDVVQGFHLGADDYVTKPFSPKELVARVRAVLRRAETASAPADLIKAGDVTIDVPRLAVRVRGRDVELTPTEFQILATLARSPGRVFTRAQLLDAVHGVAFESYERAIDAHVKNIRRKLEPDPREPRYVLTVHGVGYRFADDRG